MANLTGYFKLLTVPKILEAKSKTVRPHCLRLGRKCWFNMKDTGGLAYPNSTGQWKTAIDRRNLPKDVEILPLKQAAP